MIKFKPLHGVVFVLVIACIAVFICAQQSQKRKEDAKKQSVQAAIAAENAKKVAEEKKSAQAAAAEKERAADAAAAEKKRITEAAEEERTRLAKAAEAEREKYLAYVNTNIIRNPGEQMIAVACVSESGSINPAIADALAIHFKRDHLKFVSSFFRPTLIADGLFDDLFNGSKGLFDKLELEKSLDAILLARQDVEYPNNDDSNGIITANMHIHIVTLPVTGQIESQSWTLSANGAGFNKSDARMQAEERIIHQIAGDATMSLSELNTNK